MAQEVRAEVQRVLERQGRCAVIGPDIVVSWYARPMIHPVGEVTDGEVSDHETDVDLPRDKKYLLRQSMRKASDARTKRISPHRPTIFVLL